MSENSVTLVGRLTADPEVKFSNAGAANARFNLAVEKRWMNRQTQEWEKRTSFITVIVWDKMAENVAHSLKKGYRAIVSGTLEQRSWDTPNGEKRQIVELVADAIGPDLRFVTCELHGTDHPAAAAPAATGFNPAFDNEDPF